MPLAWYSLFFFFFFNDTSTTEIYTLSLHDALPILDPNETLSPGQFEEISRVYARYPHLNDDNFVREHLDSWLARSEEHTSELQSLTNLVCRLLLEKKKKINKYRYKLHRNDHHADVQ